MSISNITRTNTIDEWRIQTNLSANSLNTIETGVYNKTSGTLAIGSNASLQVSNTALFSTDITVARDISVGTAGIAKGNIGVGGVVSIYGPGNGLIVANNITSNGSVIVKNTILANNVTVNSNAVIVGTTTSGYLIVNNNATISSNATVVGTANIGFLGVANTGVFGKSVSIGENLNVTGNSYVTGTSYVTGNTFLNGILTVEQNITTNGSSVVKNTLTANNITVNSNVVVVGTTNTGFLGVVNTANFGQSVSIGTNLTVTSNVSMGNATVTGTLTTKDSSLTGNLSVSGNTSVTSKLTVTGDIQTLSNSKVNGNLNVDGDTNLVGNLGVTGNFTLSGQTVLDTDRFVIGSITPITIGNAYLGVYRGNTTGILGTANANAYIRWAGTNKEWQIRDVDNTDNNTSFSKILSANLITISTATTSNTTFPSSWLMKNYVDNANTNLKNYVDTSINTTTSGYQANTGAAVISITSAYQANTGAVNIDLNSEITNRQANVGSAVISITSGYQANVGAARIADQLTTQANVGAGLITTTNAYQANVGAVNIALNSEITNRQANVGAAAITAAGATSTANTNMKNYVDTAINTTTSGYQANTGAVNIALNSEITNRQANVGAGLIATSSAVTSAYQANTGAALIAAKGYYSGSSPLSINASGVASIQVATASQNGYMSSTYASKLDGIASGATNVTNNNQLTNGSNYITASAETTGTHSGLVTGPVRKSVFPLGAPITATAGYSYVYFASTTITLPSSPVVGDTIDIVNVSGTTTAVVARNGQNIMSLAEDMTINTVGASFTLFYSDSTRGWVILF